MQAMPIPDDSIDIVEKLDVHLVVKEFIDFENVSFLYYSVLKNTLF